MSSRTKAFIAIILAAFFGGGIAVVGKIGLAVIPPFTFTFFRFLIASLCMVPFLRTEKLERLDTLYPAIGISLFGVANVTIFAFGIVRTTATIAQLLYTAVPVIAAILSYVLLKERFVRKKIAGIILGLSGAIILIVLPQFAHGSVNAGTMQGNVIVMTAVVTFSLYTVLSKQYQTFFSPKIMTFIFSVTTALTLAPFSIYEYLHNPLWINQLTIPAVISIVYVGIFGGAVYYLLYQYAIKHSTPVVASMTMFLQPMATYGWAVSLLGEKLIFGVVCGAVTSVAGAWLVITAKKTTTAL